MGPGAVTLPLDKRGPHEAALRQRFARFEYRGEHAPVTDPVCILLFTNRSGSTLVAEYLRATGRVVAMGEPLNHPIVGRRAARFGLRTFPDYLAHEYRRWHQPGTVYGFKASWDQALMLWRAGILPHYFSNVRWILVQREDLVAQAISFSIAEQTQRWHSFDAGDHPAPVYDYARILRRVQTLAQSNAALQAVCSLLQLAPCRIDHDAFVAAPEEHTHALADHLGLGEVSIDPERIRLHRQRDGTSREFRERFLADYRRSFGTDPAGGPG